MKNLVFRYYAWIALLTGSVACLLAFRFVGTDRISVIGAVIAGTLGFCYFVQQQKLSETALFHDLFTAFNSRYDKLNGELADILEAAGEPAIEQKRVIVDYFNLCAEEYLFYREGYIHREVWRSWCRGMLWYLRRHPFRDIWHEEIQSESFYGLTLEKIQDGAN